MYCQKCGKELNENAKFCENCGNKINSSDLNSNAVQQPEIKTPSKKVTTGCLSILLIVVIIIIGINLAPLVTTISPVFDAMQFYTNIGTKTTVTQEELIQMLGQPEKAEAWDYTDSNSKKYKITTLTYDNGTAEYNFYENHLQRISLFKDITLVHKNRNFELFNLKRNDLTRLKDTGSSLRYYYCGINDLWFWSITNNIASGTHISYTDLFSK